MMAKMILKGNCGKKAISTTVLFQIIHGKLKILTEKRNIFDYIFTLFLCLFIR